MSEGHAQISFGYFYEESVKFPWHDLRQWEGIYDWWDIIRGYDNPYEKLVFDDSGNWLSEEAPGSQEYRDYRLFRHTWKAEHPEELPVVLIQLPGGWLLSVPESVIITSGWQALPSALFLESFQELSRFDRFFDEYQVPRGASALQWYLNIRLY